MKVTPLDFILCTLAMGIIFFTSLIAVHYISYMVSVPVFGSYHVVFDVVLLLLAYGILSALAIRLMLKLRPFKLGAFDMTDANFTYWKLLMMVFDVGRFTLKPFTTLPMRPLVFALYGARIGKNVAIGGTIEDGYLVTIGDGSVIGNQTLISGNMTNRGTVLFGTVTIGRNVTVGANSVLMPNVTIGDDAVIGIGSVLLPGTVVPAGESWRGNPARKWQ